MTDFAELVLSAKTDGLKKGETALDQLADEAERTERRTGKATDGMGRAFTGAGATIAKAAAGAVVAMASFQQASQAITQARGFSAAMAETSTLIDGTAQEMDALSQAARGLAKEFGTTATDQVNAFYQAISAGADGVAGASEVLDAANRLAVGGVTDVTTGVDALTTAVNAYGPTVLTAAGASDAMFVAMKAGKTTIGELSSALGQIVPISAAAGVSFDETVAAIAALTTQGLSTSAATTGLRGVLSAVIAPTKGAADAAKALGIEFNAQALEARGLAGFLDDVIVAADGNTEAIAALFGSVEALNAVLAFAGGGGEAFGRTLDGMAQKAGATQQAVDKISDGLDQRWNRATAAASDVALTFGNALLTVAVPALEGLASVTSLAAENADLFAISLGVLGASQIPAMVAGLTSMAAWLATSEGLFIAGAVAAKGMAIAMNAIPLVAVATGLTLLYREFRSNAQAAENFRLALGNLETAQDALNDATTRYYRDVSQANLDAMRTTAERAVQETRKALEAARDELDAASFTTNFFGANLYETDRMKEARAVIADLEGALFDAEAQLSAVDHAQSNFNRTQGDTADDVDKTTGSIVDLSDAAERLGSSLSGVQDFGEGFEYLSLQITTLNSGLRDIEAANAAAALEAVVIEATALGDQLGLATEDLFNYYSGLADVAMAETFADQAVALAEVIRGLEVATGGAENMGAAAFGVYEALLKALNTSISLAGVDYSGSLDGITAQAAHLADQFGIAYGYARALATMEVSSTTVLGFGSDVPAAGDGLGVGGAPIGFSTKGVTVPRLKIDEPSIPSLGGGGGGGGGRKSGGGGGRGESEAQREHNKLMAEGERLTERLWTEQEKYNDAVEQADRLLDAGAISLDTYNKHMDQLSAELADAQWGDVIDGLTSVSDALVDAAIAGEDMGEAFRNVLQQMVADILKSGIHDLIASMFDGAGSGGGGGGLLGGLFGAIFGGQRANGGGVNPGEVYEVGEQGREWFVPSSQGHIIPNHKIGEGAPARAAVEVIGGNLKLSDGGQIMAEVNVVAAETSAGMVARNNAMIQQKQRRR